VSGRVAFATLGCRVNQADTQQLQAALEARGFSTVPFGTAADVIVVNTCTVTARAEVSDRQAIRRARRSNPDARVVVTGCWAQTSAAEVAREPGVDLVVGNADKPRLPALFEAILRTRRVPVRVEAGDLRGARLTLENPSRALGRSRAFVKVQDGCQHRCAFCIVPRARGDSRSLPAERVADQVRALVAAGHVEITLTGVDLGHYGADLVPRTSLAALLRGLVEIPGVRWLRLSSMLPAYFTDDVLDVVTGAPAIAPHFHIPLQSGSDRVLRAMRRPYTVAMYRSVVERLARAIADLGLGADVIAGFPAERADDADATRALIEALPFTYLHVFPYSDRPGTEAASRPAHVDRATIARRAERLRQLGAAKAAAFRSALVGRTEDVLVLETRDRATGGLVGLTGNYVEVVFDGADTLMRGVATVRLDRADGGMRGVLVGSARAADVGSGRAADVRSGRAADVGPARGEHE
jgi:threonylcarbamoyladenosine tRNA methylthiotransferase MtaB